MIIAGLNVHACSILTGDFPGGSVVKNPPAVQEMQIQTLGWEDSLDEEMALTPVILPGKSHGQKSLMRYIPWVTKSRTQLSD